MRRKILYWYPDVSIGDYVPLTIGDGNNASTKEVEVVAIGDYALGLTSYSSFLMLEEGLQKLYDGNLNFAYQIYAKRNYDAKVEQSIKHLIADSDVLQYESWQSYYEQWKSALEFTNAACYAFLGVLGAICIMNMVNTMLSGVHIRKKEIGMMQPYWL